MDTMTRGVLVSGRRVVYGARNNMVHCGVKEYLDQKKHYSLGRHLYKSLEKIAVSPFDPESADVLRKVIKTMIQRWMRIEPEDHDNLEAWELKYEVIKQDREDMKARELPYGDLEKEKKNRFQEELETLKREKEQSELLRRKISQVRNEILNKKLRQIKELSGKVEQLEVALTRKTQALEEITKTQGKRVLSSTSSAQNQSPSKKAVREKALKAGNDLVQYGGAFDFNEVDENTRPGE